MGTVDSKSHELLPEVEPFREPVVDEWSAALVALEEAYALEGDGLGGECRRRLERRLATAAGRHPRAAALLLRALRFWESSR